MVSETDEYRKARYAPGQSIPLGTVELAQDSGQQSAQAGDFILTHSRGIFSWLIRFGQRRYWRKDERTFTHWSHSALIINDLGDIIEAFGGGVQKRNISIYKDTEYVVVHLKHDTSDKDRRQTVAFAEACLNESYGLLAIVSISLGLLTGMKFGFGIDGQQICSALVARSLERTGIVFREKEPWHFMPADLAKHFAVNKTGERGQPPAANAGLYSYSRPGRRKR